MFPSPQESLSDEEAAALIAELPTGNGARSSGGGGPGDGWRESNAGGVQTLSLAGDEGGAGADGEGQPGAFADLLAEFQVSERERVCVYVRNSVCM